MKNRVQGGDKREPEQEEEPGGTQATAMVQWAELHSTLSLSMAFSTVACSIVGSRTWSDLWGSGSEAILSSVALLGDGTSVALGSGSPSAVGSGCGSAQRGDGGLGSGSGVALVRSSSGQTVREEPFLASVHSTKAAKSARGPFSDDSALHAVLRLAL
ncbi:hypothetical protein QQF64_036211 [Cirrhinus molitorella]|uniref:Uncharacterized protein n=1 Tax=Cirrhinus molitorella TaxID=172907 RepID=A0ABR3NHZ5_9TELE